MNNKEQLIVMLAQANIEFVSKLPNDVVVNTSTNGDKTIFQFDRDGKLTKVFNN